MNLSRKTAGQPDVPGSPLGSMKPEGPDATPELSALLDRTRAQYAAGHYEAVIETLRPLQGSAERPPAELARAGAEALGLLARAASRTRQQELAAKAAVKAARLFETVKKSGGPLSARELSDAGIALYLAGRLPAAAEALREAVAKADSASETYLFHGLVLAGNGRNEEAVQALNLAQADTQTAPDDFERRRLEALSAALLELGRNKESADAFRELADLHYRAGRYTEALTSLEQTLRLNPLDEFALAKKGEALRLLDEPDRYPQALQALEEAIRLRPDFAWAYASYGEALRVVNRLEDAAAAFERAVALDQSVAQWHYRRGDVLRLLDRREHALESFDQALAIEPNDPRTLSQRGEVLRMMERRDEALAAFEQALALQPDDPRTLARRGEVLRVMGRLDEALADLDKALAQEPDNNWVLGSKGETLLRLGRLTEAEKTLRRAIELSSGEYAFGQASLGHTLLEQNRDKEAMTYLEKAVEQDSTSTWALEGLALALYRCGKVQRGFEVTKALLALSPDDAWTRAVTGVLFYLVEDYESSVRELKRSVELDAGVAWMQDSMACSSLWLWLSKEDQGEDALLEQAVAAATKATTLAPGDLTWRSTLGDTLWESKGRREDAVREYRRTLDEGQQKAKLDFFDARDAGWSAYRLSTTMSSSDDARPMLAEAERLTMEALALKSDKAASFDAISVRFFLALVMLCTERFALSLREYDAAMSLAAEYQEPRVYKGLIGRATLQLAEALKERTPLAASPHAQRALRNLQSNYPTYGQRVGQVQS